MTKVVILGGGISGLSLAWFLRRAAPIASGLDITILDKAGRLGGWVHTEYDFGQVLERGPRGFKPSGKGVETLKLIEDLGLQSEVVFPTLASTKRFLYHKGHLQQLPDNMRSLILNTPPVLGNPLPALMKEPFLPKGLWADETIHSFMSRRFGPKIATIFDGMCSGIYAGDVRALSIRSCFPLLWKLEKRYGSVLKGAFYMNEETVGEESHFVQTAKKYSQVSFRTGMATLVNTLSASLQSMGTTTLPRTNVAAISMATIGDKQTVCVTAYKENGEEFVVKADHVFSTLSATDLSTLLPKSNEYSAMKSKLEALCKSVDVAVVNLLYNAKRIKELDGFGYLVPSMNREGVLGVAWDSSIFPSQVAPSEVYEMVETDCSVRMTVMMGGAHDPQVIHADEGELTSRAIGKVCGHMGITQQPVFSMTGVMKQCIPQYTVGHYKRLREVEACVYSAMPRLHVLGTSFYGVGIADCVFQAKSVADRFVSECME